MDGYSKRRILLVGKTGDGKSSSGNTILGGTFFKTEASPSSITIESVAAENEIVKLIDTQGFFGTEQINTEVTEVTEDKTVQKQMALSIVECSPGPHAIIIVLRVGRFTKHEMETLKIFTDVFGEDMYKYAVVLFTHGYDLKGQTIEDFVKKNDGLETFVKKCGHRCHVIDNEHWNGSDQSPEINNKTHVKKLLNTIEELVKTNGSTEYYTNDILQAIAKDVEEEREKIRVASNGDLSESEIMKKAKQNVCKKITMAGCATGVLLGVLLGVPVMVGASVYHCGKNLKEILINLSRATLATVGTAGSGTLFFGKGGLIAMSVGAGVVGGLVILVGAVVGGIEGAKAAKTAQNAQEAAEKTVDKVFKRIKLIFTNDGYKQL